VSYGEKTLQSAGFFNFCLNVCEHLLSIYRRSLYCSNWVMSYNQLRLFRHTDVKSLVCYEKFVIAELTAG